MPNRLAGESSPYLLQHQSNPVDWYPWGEEALRRAKDELKPIFLSIGYAACHWCHVMEHESFEDPATAEIMNELFINIKVDREERPDLDTIYMNAVVAMTGHGGWPMSVFLTPDLEPFYGGTYFPPERRYNMPSFREVLTSVSRAWVEDRQQVNEIGARLKARLQKELTAGLYGGASFSGKTLENAAMSLAQDYDWKNGGWGQAPKFPQAMAIDFLIRRSVRGDNMAASIVKHALSAMAQGGMYDVLAGGFHRYSVDDIWLVPHFEKMLYDNALLSRAYLHGYLLTGDPQYKNICTETIDFVLEEMRHDEGGFFSSLDADSEGEEGTFYTWTFQELEEILEEPGDFETLGAVYDLPEAGNFEGKIILRRRHQGPLPPEVDGVHLEKIHSLLRAARLTKPRPATDDKILAAWNGLMLVALSEAARYFSRDDYKVMAMRNGEFLLEHLVQKGRVRRAWRDGVARVDGFLDDYAALILGLVALYQTDPDPRWFQAARDLTTVMLAGFKDEQGGFFDTRHDHENLLVRPKDIQDNATPSGNALAASALLAIAALDGDPSLKSLAEKPFGSIMPVAEKYPTAFSQWLSAIDTALGPVLEIALVETADAATGSVFSEALRSTFNPNMVLARSTYPPPEGGPRLLNDRPLIDDQPTAYVCQGFVCKQPVTASEDLTAQLLEGGSVITPINS
ncbi:MAG: thioredoxin domain-containing protein [Anaerolineales bacterium]|nr:thioredoxin domain-containing protein [Anaerolineales bacterium]